MESEKVKEIKKALEYNILSEFMNRLPYADEFNKLKMVSFEDILTLINELESENAYKQEHIELWFKKNEEKKNRIAELETLCNKTYEDLTKEIDRLEKEKTEQLKQFAEKLKKKSFDKNPFNDWAGSTYVVLVKDIDELLKEFINDTI